MSPSISVVIVNLNGRALLQECLDALADQDYPVDRIETILVDNGSTDDSATFVREAYPSVRVIEAGRNLGFAGGNNLGARAATGEYLAFINNDARADPGWLRALVDALEGQTEIVCAAAKILDRNGKIIDFVGPVMNLYGRAFQVEEGLPDVPGYYDVPRELFAPCGGAMLIRRDVFLRVGGFDDDYVAYFEDLDLGWRLWLYGYKVVFVPEAFVYHRQHQTGSGFPAEQRYALSEANALRTVIKNYEEQNLWRVLPFSLFMCVKRSLEQANLDRNDYRLGQPRRGVPETGAFETEPRMTRVATSFLVAIDQVADEMPRLLQKRQVIQSARVRSDDEIFERFPIRPDNLLFPWRDYHVTQEQLAADLGVPEALRPKHGSRLLIITHEAIGPKMAGPGIRAWEIACALSQRLDVMLAAPGNPTRSYPGLRVFGYDVGDPEFRSLAPILASADVVMACGSLFVRIPQLRQLYKPAIVDLEPFDLEKLAQSGSIEPQYRARNDQESMLHLRLEGTIGDFYICSSERQRDFWLGMLLATGRVNAETYGQDPTLRSLIDAVPFGLPAERPQKRRAVLKGAHPGIGPKDKVLLWSGGLWQWFDPLTLIDALTHVLRTRQDVKLFFQAGRHFDTSTVPEMPIYAQTLEHCRALGLLDRHVFFGDWIPYDERADYLLEADLGLSTHHDNLESHFATRTRLLDYIWAGVPVLATAGDTLVDSIAQRGLGRTVPPGRPDLLAQAILDMLADEGLRERVKLNAEAVREELTWTRAVEPIAGFLNRVAFAPDAIEASRSAARVRQTLERVRDLEQKVQSLEKEIQRLRSHIEDIKRGRVMRLMRAMNVALGRE